MTVIYGTPDPYSTSEPHPHTATRPSDATDVEVAAAVAAEAVARNVAIAVAKARELDYTETAVDITGLTETTFTKLGGAGVLEVSFTAPDDLPYVVAVVIRSITCTAGAAGTFIAALFNSDTDTIVGSEVPVSITTASAPTQGPIVIERFAASSGVKNYEVRYKVVTGDTFSVNAATAKASVHAYIV